MMPRRATGRRGESWRWYSADAYLFDIDGTLLRCYDRTHRSALHWAMRKVFGVETTIDGIAYHGKTDLGILRAALERVGMAGHAIDSGMAEALAVTRHYARDNGSLFSPTPHRFWNFSAAGASCWRSVREISNRSAG